MIVKGTFWILNLWVLCRLGILIGAAVLGGFLTYRIGDTVEYRLEQANLVAYASRLAHPDKMPMFGVDLSDWWVKPGQ